MAKPKGPNQSESQMRPDVFRYHDYRIFLRDWFAYMKETVPGFSLRSLASEAQLGSGHLPMVLSGGRHLSKTAFLKISPHLHLTKAELKFLDNLTQLSDEGSLQLRVHALSNMSRSFSYRKKHPNEVEFFEYMSHWYHILVREMSMLEGFRADPEWIRSRMKWKIPLSEVRVALEFLIQNGYLKVDKGGEVLAAKDALSCDDEVFSTALKQYHKQMFSLATDSMEVIPSSQRELHGYTFAINSKSFDAAQKIIAKALQEIQSLEKSEKKNRNSVYHMQLALFPLTEESGAGDK